MGPLIGKTWLKKGTEHIEATSIGAMSVQAISIEAMPIGARAIMTVVIKAMPIEATCVQALFTAMRVGTLSKAMHRGKWLGGAPLWGSHHETEG